ncbi:MAG: glycosyltransferase family 4 protein [Deltaproteobacteria bacterium]|nr:glycosyltransferase family 4 protein [Deltaproteobacteria bacterium]MBW2413723.1 glycosyltransferase family 4 protein [Deltaproteobacteria bacterium]
MRVLHLFSNYKWTGPAEPAVALAASLREAGIDAVFRSSGYVKNAAVNHVVDKSAAWGVRPITDLSLSKHRAFWLDVPDRRRLRRILADEKFDLVHCHLPNDMRIAARAARDAGIPFVRTLYDTEPHRTPRADLALMRRAAAVFVFSGGMREALLGRGFDAERVVQIDSAVDLERFRPGADLPNLRSHLGFGPDDFVAGIVARVQPQRRFDLLLDVAEEVSKQCPGFRLVVIGRGSKLARVARTPARERGLLGRVVFFPGYFEGDEFPAVLRALDVKLFMVPGTDGTARAVREALASGVPVVCTRRGILPELVHDGRNGYSVEESVPALSAALLELWRDPEKRARMGEEARRDACERFDLRKQVERVAATYASVLGQS